MGQKIKPPSVEMNQGFLEKYRIHFAVFLLLLFIQSQRGYWFGNISPDSRREKNM
ncbi:hypothetical protein [Candidatus Electronema sp. JC]|jgi:hypothetical protein|uniref:hypothetical protein n=1 Tax=Candidatus Electronema sp. JC TaxID=3401570 RepID=UPI003B427ED5